MSYKWDFEEQGIKKASEQFFEYYENAKGNDVTRFTKACEQFKEIHKILPPYSNYYSFTNVKRYYRR